MGDDMLRALLLISYIGVRTVLLNILFVGLPAFGLTLGWGAEGANSPLNIFLYKNNFFRGGGLLS